MCTVSNIGDYGRTAWPEPWKTPSPLNPSLPAIPFQPYSPPYNGPTREQFEEFLELMRAARKFDKAAGQPDCPAESKIEWMERLARHLGIDVQKVKDALA